MAHITSFDRRRRAQAMGTMSAGEDAGEMLGPILAGFLWAAGGVGLLLGGRIVLSIAAEAYTAILGRRIGAEPPVESALVPRGPPPAPDGQPVEKPDFPISRRG